MRLWGTRLSSTRYGNTAVGGGSILAAALALPGVVHAEAAPTEGLVGFKFLYYKESREWLGQSFTSYDPKSDPLTILSPSVYALVPLGDKWSVDGSVTIDSLSGATPWYHSSASFASKMEDNRTAGDVRVTRYFRRAVWSLGAAFSTEDDYESKALSTDLRLSTDDNNTTFTLGIGVTDDTLKPNPGTVSKLRASEGKNNLELLAGITRVLTPFDILQLNVTHSRASGYLTDPYKNPDVRPDSRNATAVLVRWNHFFSGPQASLRSSYRYYRDSWDVTGHTVGVEWAQPVGARYVVTPSVRYVTQSAANFYVDPLASGVPPAQSLRDDFITADQRLSSFGGITLGLKGQVNLGKWTFDAKYDYYTQRSSLRIFGEGSPGLGTYKASFVQVGFARRF